jgi:hypothetical protein
MKIAYQRIERPNRETATGSESFGTRSAHLGGQELLDLWAGRQ